MKRKQLIFVLSFLLILIGSTIKGDKIESPLNAPEPPFINKQNSISKNVAGKIVGRSIIFGNKKLTVQPNGELKFYSNNKLLFKAFFYANTAWSSYMTNRYQASIPIDWHKASDKIGITSSSYDDATKSFIIKGELPLVNSTNGKALLASFTETVTLSDDSETIRISLKFDIPNQEKKYFKSSAMMFTLSSFLDTFSIDKKIYHFGAFSHYKRAPIVFGKNSNDHFTIIPENQCSVNSSERSGSIHDFRLYCNKKSHDLVFSIRPGASPAPAPQKVTYAGVDFKSVDDLELPDFNSSRNLIKNPSFEQGMNYYTLESQRNQLDGTLRIFPDNNQRFHGQHSLKWTSLPVKHPRSTFLKLSPIPVTPGDYTFSFYAKKSDTTIDPKTTFSLLVWKAPFKRIYDKRWTLSSEKSDWVRYTTTFSVNKNTALSLWFNCNSTSETTIWLDSFQLEKAKTASPFTTQFVEGMLITNNKNNFLSYGEKINASLLLSANKASNGSITITVKNFFGEIIHKEQQAFQIEANEPKELKLTIPELLPEGIYILKADYSLKNGKRCNDFFRFSVMNFLHNKHNLASLFSNRYYANTKLYNYAALPNYLERCRKIGVGGLGWSGFYSKARSLQYQKYNMNPIGTMATWCTRRAGGKSLYMYIPYGKNKKLWDFRLSADGNVISPEGQLTDEYIEKFKTAVVNLIQEYSYIPGWTLGGEMWGKFPDLLKNHYDSYLRLQIAFYEAVKSVDPTLKVIGPFTPCNIRLEDGIAKIKHGLERLAGRIKYDLVGIHSYIPGGPYALEGRIAAFLDMLDKSGYDKTPVFFPEGMSYGPYSIPQWGIDIAAWSSKNCWYFTGLSYDMGWAEKLSAAWYARSYLICMKYRNRVACATSAASVNNLFMDANMTPRAFQKIPNTLGNLLGNSRFVKDLSFARYAKCLVFEDAQQRPVAVVWSKIPKVDQGFAPSPWAVTNIDGQQVEIFDLMGAKRKNKFSDSGNLTFPVSPFPFFIRGKAGNMDRFCKAMKNTMMLGDHNQVVSIVPKLKDSHQYDFVIKNEVNKTLSGILEIAGVKKNISISPQQDTTITASLGNRLKTNKITNVKIPYSFRDSRTNKILSRDKVEFEGLLVSYTSTPINIDSKIDDWQAIPTLSYQNLWSSNKKGKTDKLNPKDFQGKFKVAWDKDNLYILVIIKDNIFSHHEYAKPGMRYNNDAIQLFIDTMGNARSKMKGYDYDDYEYGIFPNKQGNAGVAYRYSSPDVQLTLGVNAPINRQLEPNIPVAFRKTADGYIYEFALPAKYLLPLQLKNNHSFGLNLQTWDRDNEKQATKFLTLTPPGTSGFNNPHLYPIFLLHKE